MTVAEIRPREVRPGAPARPICPAAGAVVGSWFAGAGAAPGALIGGAGGAIILGAIGWWGGTTVAETVYDWIFTPLEEEEWVVVCSAPSQVRNPLDTPGIDPLSTISPMGPFQPPAPASLPTRGMVFAY